MEKFYVSRKKYEDLVNEIKRLKEQKAQLSDEIGEAAAQGDLKENAEYHAAKEKQAETLRRIDDLERDEVAMHMPDGTVIDFGPAKNLRAKARRAAQIIGWCRRNEKGPQRMDFRFFENGQVFLTQLGK